MIKIKAPVPTYKHDCTRCTFIASFHLISNVIDLWLACSPTEKYYIVRYSSEGSDYSTVHNYYPDNPVIGYKENPNDQILFFNFEVLEFLENKVKNLEKI